MQITLEFLNKLNACSDGIDYFIGNNLENIDVYNLIEKLNNDDKCIWSNWLISRLLEKENKIRYAIFAAELVLHIFEKKYPTDDRPRKAIEAAKKYLKTKNAATADATAYAAADATADAAAYAAADAAADVAAVKKETYIKIINFGIELLKSHEIGK